LYCKTDTRGIEWAADEKTPVIVIDDGKAELDRRHAMKILALDGGGVFGRVQSRILAEANCYDKFDAFAGTSIGSPQAMSIALGRPEMVCPEFFDKWMATVFRTSWFRRVNILQSEYPDKGLNTVLQAVFESATLGDAKKPVFVTAANIGQKTLKVFSSLNFEDQSWPCWEVARAATP